MKKVQVLSLWIAVSMMPWMAMARTDAFYEQRLKAGKDALAARRGPEAAEELRIAVFGFIDEPKLLAEALAYLAIAQNGLGRTTDVESTLNRFIDSERRAAGYDRQSLPEEVRVQFEALLTKQFGRTALAAVPSLAPIVSSDTPRRAAAPAVAPVVPPTAPPPTTSTTTVPQNDVRPAPTQQSAPPSAPARTPQNDSRPAVSTPPPAASQPSTSPAAPAQQPPAQAPARVVQNDVKPAQSTAAAQTQPATQPSQTQPAGDAADQARQMIASRRAAQAVGVLMSATEREPQRRELRLLLLQAAAMTSDWKLAAAQVALLRPFSDTEPVFMFYAAVTFWESNRPAEARELLERALPRLNRTPYVESYVKKIVPERAAP